MAGFGTSLTRIGRSTTNRRGSTTSTSTSTSAETTRTFSSRLLSSMSRTSTILSSYFAGGRRTGGSTMKFTTAGAVIAKTGGGISSAGASSLLAPGSSDIASLAAGSSGVAGLLAGGGTVVDAFRRSVTGLIDAARTGVVAGRGGGALGEATGGRLRLVVEASIEDPRDRRARERGEPPVPPEEGEEFTGPDTMTLRSDEKPAILAVIEENLRDNGTPERVTLVIKRLISDRFRPISYTIYKKSVFTDRAYNRGVVLPATSLGTVMSPRYVNAAREAGFSIPDIITYTDDEIEAGRVYAYKIKCEYDADTSTAAEEREEVEAIIDALGGGSISDSSAISDNILTYGGRGVVTEALATSLGISTDGLRRSERGGSTSTGTSEVDLGTRGGRF